MIHCLLCLICCTMHHHAPYISILSVSWKLPKHVTYSLITVIIEWRLAQWRFSNILPYITMGCLFVLCMDESELDYKTQQIWLAQLLLGRWCNDVFAIVLAWSIWLHKLYSRKHVLGRKAAAWWQRDGLQVIWVGECTMNWWHHRNFLQHILQPLQYK